MNYKLNVSVATRDTSEATSLLVNDAIMDQISRHAAVVDHEHGTVDVYFAAGGHRNDGPQLRLEGQEEGYQPLQWTWDRANGAGEQYLAQTYLAREYVVAMTEAVVRCAKASVVQTSHVRDDDVEVVWTVEAVAEDE